MSNLVTIKLLHGEEIRRVSIAPSIENLRRTATALFGAEAERLTYRDEDGDTIVVGSDAELIEALRTLAPATPKFTVTLASAPSAAAPAPESNSNNSNKSNNSSENNNAPKLDEFFASLASIPQQLLGAAKANGELAAFARNLGVDLTKIESWEDVAKEVEKNKLVHQLFTNNFKQLFEQAQQEAASASAAAASSDDSNDGTNADANEQRPAGCAHRRQHHMCGGRGRFFRHHQHGGAVRHSAMCDGCRQPIVGVRHKCIDCADFDYCADCFQTKPNEAHNNAEHEFLAVHGRFGWQGRWRMMHAERQRASESAAPKVFSIVEHVTLQDDAIVKPHSQFTKVWQIQNASEEALEGPIYVRFLDGERLGTQWRTLVSGDSLAPGAQAHVVVDGRTSADSGTKVARFVLTDKHNKPIPGDSLEIKLNVQ